MRKKGSQNWLSNIERYIITNYQFVFSSILFLFNKIYSHDLLAFNRLILFFLMFHYGPSYNTRSHSSAVAVVRAQTQTQTAIHSISACSKTTSYICLVRKIMNGNRIQLIENNFTKRKLKMSRIKRKKCLKKNRNRINLVID